ncbi:hypothetical protein KA005_19220 [bacterium]|nr:hypothetical protein [bacterium]
MDLNAKQLHTLRHMLGINTPNDRVPKPYRNYAAVISGDPEFIKLERLGAIREYQVRIPTHYAWYECTKEGRAMAMKSHRDIRKTKTQRKYTAYLDMTDVYPDLTFKDFLTHPDFST